MSGWFFDGKYFIIREMRNQTVEFFSSFIKKSLKLGLKDREILLARLKGKTLQKIGKKYHLTAERIRQIENKALKKYLKRIYQPFLFDQFL